MAREAFFVAPARTVAADWLAEAGYVAFLLLIFVGLTPFAIRDPVTLAAGESGFAATGDVVRQLAYLGVFAVIAVAAIRDRGIAAMQSVPAVMLVLLAWCMLSATWASAPDVSFRRAVLAAVIVISAMTSVTSVGPARALALLRLVLAGVLIVNWLSIAVVPQAIHLPGETDPGLVGDWRGLYFHKNIAGSVTALSALLFFFSTLDSRRLTDFALFVAAVLFTVMTHSKSSLGLLPIAIFFGLIYRFAWRRGIDRAIVGLAAGLVAVVGIAVVVMDWQTIARLFEDPTQFTGRTAIWQGEIAFIAQHPMLGSGYGTFADTGAASPLHNYVGDVWVQNISHGHNAYLQLLVTIGGVGFALAFLNLIALPLWTFLRTDDSHIGLKSLLLALFVFMIFHDMLESDFLEEDSPAWIAFLLALSMLRELHRKPAAAIAHFRQ